MSNPHKQRKITKSTTIKVLCLLIILLLLGLIYNLIVATDDVPMTEQEEEEIQKRNADIDTIDIVGDYLWKNMRPRPEDLRTEAEKAEEKSTTTKDDKDKTSSDKSLTNENEAPIAAPAPDITPSVDLPAKQTVPAVDKMETPKIEKLE